jgi:hypothetical protein
MNPDFADALRRRLEPAWPFAAALRLLTFGLAGLCDAAFDMRNVDRVVSNRSVLLLALLLLFLRGLGLLRFLRHAALLAVSEWRCRAVRIDVHCTSSSTAANEKIRISLTKYERQRRVRAASRRDRRNGLACGRANRARSRRCRREFPATREMPVEWALFDHRIFVLRSRARMCERGRARAARSRHGVRCALERCENFFAQNARQGARGDGIVLRTRESVTK